MLEEEKFRVKASTKRYERMFAARARGVCVQVRIDLSDVVEQNRKHGAVVRWGNTRYRGSQARVFNTIFLPHCITISQVNASSALQSSFALTDALCSRFSACSS